MAGIVAALVGGGWAVNARSADDGADREAADDVAPVAESQEDSQSEPPLPPALPVAQGEFHESFDFLRNRPLAHRLSADDDGLSIWADGGSFDFVRYVQGNHRRDWILEAQVDDGDESVRTVAGLRGRTAQMTLPAVDLDAQVLELSLFNPARYDNNLRLRVNGTWLDAGKLEPGWATVAVELDDAVVRADNQIDFEFSNLGRIEGVLSGGAVEWARFGPAPVVEADDEAGGDEAHLDDGEVAEAIEPSGDTEPVDDDGDQVDPAVAESEELEEQLDDDERVEPHQLIAGQGAMSLEPGQGLSWMVWLHDDVHLDLEFGGQAGCGLAIEITLEAGDGQVERVLREERLLVEGRGEVQRTTVELPIDEEQVGRVDLKALNDPLCEVIGVERARLIRPGLPGRVPDHIEPPKYVLFWVIDTLRADYLPIHFETDVQAPHLKRLAEEGVTFETAYVQGTESRASHASLFTGKYPERHGVMARGRVNPQLPILPHFFQDAGYTTGILAANGYVSHLLNLNRGWDHYRNFIHEEVGLSAQNLWDDGLAWIRTLDEDEPFFLYLGTIDPHATYRRHDDFIGLYEPDDYNGRFQRFLSGHQLGDIKSRAMTVTEREKERIINLYKNEISFNDHVFGKMRETLEEKGIWDETLIVVTSDHGEEFWEHGSVGHGHNVHQEMVHVPLIFHYPNGLPQGRVVRSGGEVVDVLPTILDLLGKDPLEDRQGRSLLPVIFGEHGGYPAPAMSTQYMLQYGMQIRHWKLYLRSGSMRLYDRREDPLEMEDIRDDHPLASRWLQDSVAWFRAHRRDWDKSTWGVPNNLSEDFLELIGDM